MGGHDSTRGIEGMGNGVAHKDEGYKCKESKRAHINRIRAHEKDTGRKIKEV